MKKDDALWIPLALALIVAPSLYTRADANPDDFPITVRPFTLGASVSELAGHNVWVLDARVVEVFEPRALVIDAGGRDFEGIRYRTVVLVHPGVLRQAAGSIVGSKVTISGVARTLLSAQLGADVPWPSAFDRKLVDRLEIHAAVIATSVQTAEGVELTDQAPLTERGASR